MTHPVVAAALALGSNVGDRRAHIEAALAALGRVPGVKLVARGPMIENPAVGKRGVDPGGAYVNSACVVQTTLDAHQLMGRLHHIERDHGRERTAEQAWGPRTLDIDLLMYGDEVIQDAGLVVPHPRMHERRFVLEPLAAIAPGWVVAGLGKSVRELLRGLDEVQNGKKSVRGKSEKAAGESKTRSTRKSGKSGNDGDS
jgi:2-amino-4-hydroxy-6-hydroxymethyldihydropteridine diphosphokinase